MGCKHGMQGHGMQAMIACNAMQARSKTSTRTECLMRPESLVKRFQRAPRSRLGKHLVSRHT